MQELRHRIAALFLILFALPVFAQDKPNIVFIFMDNFGYGELGVYGGGITRGGATPQIDALAAEGVRLTNFNVEVQCTPSRAALMTGRYAIRTGNATVPITTGMYGLTQWEITMAEMLSDEGYATGMFGKWHLAIQQGVSLPTRVLTNGTAFPTQRMKACGRTRSSSIPLWRRISVHTQYPNTSMLGARARRRKR